MNPSNLNIYIGPKMTQLHDSATKKIPEHFGAELGG